MGGKYPLLEDVYKALSVEGSVVLLAVRARMMLEGKNDVDWSILRKHDKFGQFGHIASDLQGAHELSY